MNIACYGLGRRAEPYLRELARRPDVSVIGLADADGRAAEQAAATWQARVFGDLETMLAEVRSDALLICTEPGRQDAAVALAVEKRLPFLIEPPGGLDCGQAFKRARQIEEFGLVSTVGYRAASTDVVREAREYVGANPVPLILGWWLAGPEVNPTVAVEDLLTGEACRFLDAMCYFCGEVMEVRSRSAGAGPIHKGVVVELEFEAGTIGILTCSCFTRPEPRLELELMGTGWSLGFTGDFATLKVAERDKTMILYGRNDPVGDQVAAFLASVATGNLDGLKVNYSDAVRTLAVCQAALLSIREGRPVSPGELETAEENEPGIDAPQA
jgi:predicted dehydrogenase